MRHHGQDPGYITSFNPPMIQFKVGLLATASFKWISQLRGGHQFNKVSCLFGCYFEPRILSSSQLWPVLHTTSRHHNTRHTTSKWLQGSKFIPCVDVYCVVNLYHVFTTFRPQFLLIHRRLLLFSSFKLYFISFKLFNYYWNNLKVDIFISVVKL